MYKQWKNWEIELIKRKQTIQNKERKYLKCRGHISHKIFDNNLVAIRKGKLVLKLNKRWDVHIRIE